MKKQLFLLALLLFGANLPISKAQFSTPKSSADTFRIQNFPLRFWYEGKKIKKPQQLQSILLTKNDAQINRDWQTSKTLRNVGTGIMVVGLGFETAGFLKTLNSDGGDENNLVLKGAGIMLGGVILQAIGNGPLKRAIRRFNGLQTNHIQPTVAPPIPTVYKAKSPAIDADTIAPPPKPKPAKNPTKGFSVGTSWGGAAIGLGWSKQKLNYEKYFEDPLKNARIYSFSLQYGQQVSETFGWQAEFGLTQHGYREEAEDYTEGVETEARIDLRARYLELPFLLSFQLPIGGEYFRLEAMPGVSVGVLNSAKVVIRAKGAEDDTKVKLKASSKIDLRDVEFNDKLDAALLLGLRVTKNYGPGRIFLEGRYHFGILNLERNNEFEIEDEKSKAFNRTLLLRTGYQIPIQ